MQQPGREQVPRPTHRGPAKPAPAEDLQQPQPARVPCPRVLPQSPLAGPLIRVPLLRLPTPRQEAAPAGHLQGDHRLVEEGGRRHGCLEHQHNGRLARLR